MDDYFGILSTSGRLEDTEFTVFQRDLGLLLKLHTATVVTFHKQRQQQILPLRQSLPT